jgi:hypothetical protein
MNEPMTLCISLGGSRLEVGLIVNIASEPKYFGTGSVNWRQELASVSPSARALCDLVTSLASKILKHSRQEFRKDLKIGVAFPGPHVGGTWCSNNLTDDFRDGIRLEGLLNEALGAEFGECLFRPVVVFDAQADAGGELYHPDGVFKFHDPVSGSCVLNVATGIAAGFVDSKCRWGVLHTSDDFKKSTLGRFDAGGGQLGRHLFVDPEGNWSYHYRPFGQVPKNVPGIRMTDFLSGPALSARLVLEAVRLGKQVVDGAGVFEWVESEAKRLLDQSNGEILPTLQEMSSLIRANPEPLSRLILAWADRALKDQDTPHSLREMLFDFREIVASDFGRALAILQLEQGWDHFSHRIVLTGGVGQNLFVGSDQLFLPRISSFLSPDTTLVRSRLSGGGERAAWFFHRGVFG